MRYLQRSLALGPVVPYAGFEPTQLHLFQVYRANAAVAAAAQTRFTRNNPGDVSQFAAQLARS